MPLCPRLWLDVKPRARILAMVNFSDGCCPSRGGGLYLCEVSSCFFRMVSLTAATSPVRSAACASTTLTGLAAVDRDTNSCRGTFLPSLIGLPPSRVGDKLCARVDALTFLVLSCLERLERRVELFHPFLFW